jgi:diguanylate cyclase (GGDEF)-like protein/PAS domain S-box-containing protein
MGIEIAGRRHRRADEVAGVRLRRSESRLHALLSDTDDVIAVFDRGARVTYANPATERLLGRPVASLLGTVPLELVHQNDQARALATARATGERTGESERVELRVRHQDGSWHTVEVVVTNRTADKAVEGFVVTATDVTDRRLVESALAEVRARFHATFDDAPIGMALTTLDGRVLRANRALAQALGMSEDALEGVSIVALSHHEDREAAASALATAAAGYGIGDQTEQRWVHADGSPISARVSSSVVRGHDGQPIYLVTQVEDTSVHEANDRRIAHQAAHDPLTGLPNRSMFTEELRHALATPERREETAVLFIDLDRFKVVNDSLGHPAGDRILMTIADRLRATTRPNDTVARFEGDGFTVLCSGVSDESGARAVAARLVEAISKPVLITEGEVFVTASVGIAIAGAEMETPETLLRNADAAMHRAKDEGRDRMECFETEAHHEAVHDFRTGNDLRRALERSELRLHYQPVVRLDDAQVTGFEALIRWEHPERGLVAPGEFVGLAEDTGLIVPIGAWVLETACEQLVRWQERGADVSMSVNLAARQLAEPGLPDEVARILATTGVRPERVWLELTESALMRDGEATIASLSALRELGVQLAVDDFGTGYSSMAYLKRFPVSSLKIDRAFVDGLGHDPEDSAICEAVVSLAHSLGMQAVGEGVETPEQLAELRTLGCEYGQGYLFGRPQEASMWGNRPDVHGWVEADPIDT